MSKLLSYFTISMVLAVTSASAQVPLETQAIFRGEQVLQDGYLSKIAQMPNGNIRAWGGSDLLEVDANGALVAARKMTVQHSLIEANRQHVVQVMPGKCRLHTLGTHIELDTRKVDVIPIEPGTRCSPVALSNGEAFLFTGNDEVLTRISADFGTQTKLSDMASAIRTRMRFTDLVAIDNKIIFYADTENGAAIVAVDRTGQTDLAPLSRTPG